MTLDRSKLEAELAKFADPSSASFTGWTLNREAARHAWAAAFFTYASDMISVALAPTDTSIVFSQVETSFFDALSLENATVVAAATDFGGAWKAAIDGLLPGAGATISASSTPYTFAGMNPADVAARRASLESELATVLAAGSPTRAADLAEIAAAFHTATSGLSSTIPGVAYT
ncbi:MAG: hypothetical protein ABI678_27700 [Kofleriaceae bacterium]